jgi:hypothetical protein
MGLADGTRRLRRTLSCVLVAAALVGTTSRVSPADETSAARELAESGDFRVRVSAALVLGHTRPPGARDALERALGDGHPAVRAAAASALISLGDPAAIPALERRFAGEASPSVKAQMRVSLDQLRATDGASDPSSDRSARQLPPGVRFVVQLGSMRNGTGVRGDEIRRVLSDAARARARSLRGAAFVEKGSPFLQQAVERHLPVVTLDGNVTHISEARVAGTVQVQARVEFAVRLEQTLKGTLAGGATTFGSGPTISDEARRQLQDDAVDGAVMSALRGAEQGLLVAAR